MGCWLVIHIIHWSVSNHELWYDDNKNDDSDDDNDSNENHDSNDNKDSNIIM